MAIFNSDTVAEALENYLKSKGLKITEERLNILREALATEGHFEADDLLVILQKKNQKTSRATIYRTLDILAEAGYLRKTCLGDRAAQFEKATDQLRHDHLICLGCGAMFEFVLPELPELQDRLCRQFDFKKRDYCFQIFGLCAECMAGKK